MAGDVKGVRRRVLIWTDGLDVGLMPEAVPVDNGIPMPPLRKLTYYASEQQIVALAFIVSVIRIEIEVHSGNGHNIFSFQVLQSALGKGMFSAMPGTRIKIDPSRWSIVLGHLLVRSTNLAL